MLCKLFPEQPAFLTAVTTSGPAPCPCFEGSHSDSNTLCLGEARSRNKTTKCIQWGPASPPAHGPRDSAPHSTSHPLHQESEAECFQTEATCQVRAALAGLDENRETRSRACAAPTPGRRLTGSLTPTPSCTGHSATGRKQAAHLQTSLMIQCRRLYRPVQTVTLTGAPRLSHVVTQTASVNTKDAIGMVQA